MIPSDDPIAQEILRSIRQLVRGISIHSKLLLRQVGLTIPQLVCLRTIQMLQAQGVGATVNEISDAVQLSSATVSRIVDRLTSAGLVARERSATDRRKLSISLTETGRTRLRGVPTPLQETFLERLYELPLERRKELLDALRCVASLMDAGEIDAAPILAPEGDPV